MIQLGLFVEYLSVIRGEGDTQIEPGQPEHSRVMRGYFKQVYGFGHRNWVYVVPFGELEDFPIPGTSEFPSEIIAAEVVLPASFEFFGVFLDSIKVSFGLASLKFTLAVREYKL